MLATVRGLGCGCSGAGPHQTEEVIDVNRTPRMVKKLEVKIYKD